MTTKAILLDEDWLMIRLALVELPFDLTPADAATVAAETLHAPDEIVSILHGTALATDFQELARTKGMGDWLELSTKTMADAAAVLEDGRIRARLAAVISPILTKALHSEVSKKSVDASFKRASDASKRLNVLSGLFQAVHVLGDMAHLALQAVTAPQPAPIVVVSLATGSVRQGDGSQMCMASQTDTGLHATVRATQSAFEAALRQGRAGPLWQPFLDALATYVSSEYAWGEPSQGLTRDLQGSGKGTMYTVKDWGAGTSRLRAIVYGNLCSYGSYGVQLLVWRSGRLLHVQVVSEWTNGRIIPFPSGQLADLGRIVDMRAWTGSGEKTRYAAFIVGPSPGVCPADRSYEGLVGADLIAGTATWAADLAMFPSDPGFWHTTAIEPWIDADFGSDSSTITFLDHDGASVRVTADYWASSDDLLFEGHMSQHIIGTRLLTRIRNMYHARPWYLPPDDYLTLQRIVAVSRHIPSGQCNGTLFMGLVTSAAVGTEACAITWWHDLVRATGPAYYPQYGPGRWWYLDGAQGTPPVWVRIVHVGNQWLAALIERHHVQ